MGDLVPVTHYARAQFAKGVASGHGTVDHRDKVLEGSKTFAIAVGGMLTGTPGDLVAVDKVYHLAEDRLSEKKAIFAHSWNIGEIIFSTIRKKPRLSGLFLPDTNSFYSFNLL
jgi:hypothetical protein